MKKTYYLFNGGRLSRKDNTLLFSSSDEHGDAMPQKYIPIEGISDLYCFGSIDANSALFNFLGKSQVAVHFFDYYENYTGSFMPKDYLLAGKMQIAQTQFYSSEKKRIQIAKKFIEGASFNITKNLKYYNSRGKDLGGMIEKICEYSTLIDGIESIESLMGLEGNIRQIYYDAFEIILDNFSMNGRSKQPPQNEVNALISFGNMLCYTVCLGQIYHTQLNPTISFLHEPGYRRYSLALDLAEIFKPILVDRTIFRVLNRKEIQEGDFEKDLNRVVLKNSARKAFVKAFDDRLNETIRHRTLNRNVSYRHLIKLECYKLSKHLLGMEDYRPFKCWW